MTGIWGLVGDEFEDWLSRKREAEVLNPLLSHSCYFLGVSQGSPLSPLLSTILLSPFLLNSSQYDIVQYADDGLLYGYSELPVIHFPPESGIKLHPLKSHIVRSDNVWLRPLRFLGLTYYPSGFHTELSLSQSCYLDGGILVSSVRSGKSKQIFNFASSVLKALLHDIHSSYSSSFISPGISYDVFFMSKYFGFIQNRLYCGLSLSSISQNFTYHYLPRS